MPDSPLVMAMVWVESNHPALGGRVGRTPGLGVGTRGGGGVDNVASGFEQVGQAGGGHEIGTGEVNSDHPVPVLGSLILVTGEVTQPGDVAQYVDPAVGINRLGNRRADAAQIEQIQLDRQVGSVHRVRGRYPQRLPLRNATGWWWPDLSPKRLR